MCVLPVNMINEVSDIRFISVYLRHCLENICFPLVLAAGPAHRHWY